MQYQPPLAEETRYFCSRMLGVCTFHQHWHYEIEILYCVRGQIRVTIGENTWTATAGEAILVGSTLAHSFFSLTPDTETLILEFGTALLGNHFPALATCHLPSKPTHPRFYSLLADIYALTDRKEPVDILERQGLLILLSAFILRHLATDTALDRPLRHFRQADGIGQVLAHVAVAYSQPIPLDEAARIARYETKSFCRLFKQLMGMTFHQYLNAFRIEQACRMFRDEKQKISEVGKLCGIPEAKTFSRLFRQHTGMTPTEYVRTFCTV